MAKIEERHRKVAEAQISAIPEFDEPWDKEDAIHQTSVAIADAEAKLADHVPCQACGWCEPRPPGLHEELPIVSGALDAQADVEKRLMSCRQRVDQLETILRQALTGWHEGGPYGAPTPNWVKAAERLPEGP